MTQAASMLCIFHHLSRHSGGVIVRVGGVWALLLLLAGTLSGCDNPTDAPASSPARPVRTVTVQPSAAGDEFSQTGEIRPAEETALAFRLDGRLVSRAVDVGSAVKQGEAIAALDARDSENQLQSAKADLARSIAAERLAEQNLNRMRQLAPNGAISRSQLDEAQSNWASAVSVRESAQAGVKSAQDRLGYTRLSAPVAGVITAVSANPGQVVNAGQEVVRLATFAGRDAVFNVSERLITRGLTDPVVTISLLSNPAIKTQGRVRDVSPLADAETRTWRVRVSLIDPPPDMVLGATVEGEITLPGGSVIVLPASALTREGDNPAVLVVDSQTQTLRLQPITLRHYSDTQIIVADGLAAGDKVVTAGVSKLRVGEQVALTEAP
ncbi:efflux transporter, RND family, MFP subunit [Dickeya chrysanthemi Ech1591]|uniref:Efflux transporter, RND family, MFP subunit n=1 Tax=Dickeya chrysanthemi (strain Ech1591) TaxID=561229 RepID=C6CHT6_DICC1|nr:efflux RND transporter periplasmic adaptor subunit [Dickeya chrysanthemi]ACT08043.1 efflux transporter, RND family, MFP subunit [Dickeya chrysanthemi Ech1591]WJM84577.1 efflux RND transporter periplasmic adaptor subunit [Dickeya chrysanthemi]